MATTTRHQFQPSTSVFQVSRGLPRSRFRFSLQATRNSKDSSKGGGSGFSLRDDETLGNIGVVGVVGTALIVGGALVIFNPYAKQQVKQETIEVAIVPEPLGFQKTPDSRTPATTTVPETPKSNPAPIIKEAPPVAPPPPPPPVVVKSSTSSRKPLVQTSDNPSGAKSGGTGIGTIVAVCALVAAVGGGAAVFGKASGDEASPSSEESIPTETTTTEAPSSEETPKPIEDSPATGAEDAKQWIENWKNKQ